MSFITQPTESRNRESPDAAGKVEEAEAWLLRPSFVMAPLVCGAWAVVCLHAAFSGRLASLLHPNFQPLVVIGGAVLAVCAVLWIFLCVPSRRLAKMSVSAMLGRELNAVLCGVVLIAPPLAASAYAPESFSRGVMENRRVEALPGLASKKRPGQATLAELRQRFAETPEAVPVELTVRALLGMADDADARRLSTGRIVRMVGQAFAEAEAAQEAFELVRLHIFCCIADATSLAVRVEGELPAVIEDGDWLEVVAEVRWPGQDGLGVGVRLISAKPTAPPQPPFLY